MRGTIGHPEFYNECFAHLNEPVLLGFDVCRVIGYGEDDMDCYLIAMRRNGQVVWHTAVGGYTFLSCLEGQNGVQAHSGEHWDDLTRLDSLLAMNGAPRQTAFLVDLRRTPDREMEVA
jgi:hypothetical protein